MRQYLLTGLSVAVLLLGSACGGDEKKAGSAEGFSADEKKAAKALAEDITNDNKDVTKAQREAAECTANQIVDTVGTDKLVKSGLMTKELKVVQDSAEKLDKAVAQDIAGAIVDCQNIEAEAEANRDLYPDASDKDFDAYTECMKKIDDKLLEGAIVSTMTGDQESKDLEEYSKAAQKCAESLGEPDLGGTAP